MWKNSLKFIEPNLSGVGGIHLAPTGDRMIADVVFPVLQRIDPHLAIRAGQDQRELFIQEMLDHLEAIGRPGQHVCFVEPKYSDTGIDEQSALAEYYLERHGLKICTPIRRSCTSKTAKCVTKARRSTWPIATTRCAI